MQSPVGSTGMCRVWGRLRVRSPGFGSGPQHTTTLQQPANIDIQQQSFITRFFLSFHSQEKPDPEFLSFSRNILDIGIQNGSGSGSPDPVFRNQDPDPHLWVLDRFWDQGKKKILSNFLCILIYYHKLKIAETFFGDGFEQRLKITRLHTQCMYVSWNIYRKPIKWWIRSWHAWYTIKIQPMYIDGNIVHVAHECM